MSKHGSSLVVMMKWGWIEEMTSHVKSIDGNHLLEVGFEGFYGEYKTNINPVRYNSQFNIIHRLQHIFIYYM